MLVFLLSLIAALLVTLAVLGVVLVRKLNALRRWKLPTAVTELRLGDHQVLVVKLNTDIDPDQFQKIHGHLVRTFAAYGVNVPILLFDRHLDFSVAGQGSADAGQKVPA